MTEDNKVIFQVGDKVNWAGAAGIIVEFIDEPYYPLLVRFGRSDHLFTLDGRYMTCHTEPSLKLIERPKKRVKKTFYMVVSSDELKNKELITYGRPLSNDSSVLHSKDWQVVSFEAEVEE